MQRFFFHVGAATLALTLVLVGYGIASQFQLRRGLRGIAPGAAQAETIVSKGSFVKCQMRGGGSTSYPTCPAGYTAFTTYPSFLASCLNDSSIGVDNTAVSDATSLSQTGSCYGYGAYACTVCKEN